MKQNSQDFDRLSAYIDNQLSPAEKAKLEARLTREPELQLALRDLQQTVHALRVLPPVKVPRNFTLTAKQAGAYARRGSLFSAFRLASALATVIFTLVIAGDFAASRGLGLFAASAPLDVTTSQGAATTTLAVPAAAQPATPTPELNARTFAGAAVASETSSADAELTPVAGLAVINASDTPTAEGGRFVATPGPTDKAVEDSLTATPFSVAVAPPTATPLQPTTSAAPQTTAPASNVLRLIEVALAVLAVLLGLAAWLIRRA